RFLHISWTASSTFSVLSIVNSIYFPTRTFSTSGKSDFFSSFVAAAPSGSMTLSFNVTNTFTLYIFISPSACASFNSVQDVQILYRRVSSDTSDQNMHQFHLGSAAFGLLH